MHRLTRRGQRRLLGDRYDAQVARRTLVPLNSRAGTLSAFSQHSIVALHFCEDLFRRNNLFPVAPELDLYGGGGGGCNGPFTKKKVDLFDKQR